MWHSNVCKHIFIQWLNDHTFCLKLLKMFDDLNSFSDADDHGDFDLHQEIARSAFADMCHDWERNQKYDLALKRTIERLHAEGEEAHVLDIGTGSGLLSMMAVRAGADSVTACEAFRPMANCAELVIAANKGMPGRIKLIKKKSTEISVGEGKDMERTANVLVTELFDTELIGEGAIATFKHALEHLLEPSCRVIPHSATVYAQIVECPLALSWIMPKNLSNSDGDVLLRTPKEIVECRGSPAVFDIQLSQLTSFNALSEPTAVFEFEWSSNDELKYERHTRKLVKIINSGMPHVVFMWWDLKMDKEETVLLSCAPFWAHPDYEKLKLRNKNPMIPTQNVIPWRDHWMQAMYYLPQSKKALNKGQETHLDAFHDEFSLWFSLEQSVLEPAHCSCGFHNAYSRSRIGQVNEGPRNKKILNYLEQVLKKDSVVLVLGEGSLLGLALCAMGTKKVILLEANRISRQCMESYARFNKLDTAEIISDVDQLTAELSSEITHIFGEPFFGSAILPWHNAFQFGALLREIRPRVKANVMIIPKSVSIYGLPVEFLDLQKIMAPLGKCEGFDLCLMDEMIEQHSSLTDSSVEAQPLWEYPCFALGSQAKMLTINFEDGFAEPKISHGMFNITMQALSSECNGIALWADWHLDGSLGPKTTISSGPLMRIDDGPTEHPVPISWNSNWRQGVHLTTKMNKRQSISWSVQFNAQLDDCYFQFN
ncbi:protein arginine N-methyltransferase 7 [Toxorhynchites rutilus septentrionalis]|uniref:protein arginine N-methyltransferase 7 n=1 Tax=Toxorhynchites rutilus septentrionalis TaxID=329112 RepID=UPI0024793FBF|nr:protein arginine N-methyltransferase 7 [Toxorhynchites rutilus septentrionalis]